MKQLQTKIAGIKEQRLYVFLFFLVLSQSITASTSERITAEQLDPTQILLSQKSCKEPNEAEIKTVLTNPGILRPVGFLQETINPVPFITLQSYAKEINSPVFEPQPVKTSPKDDLLKTNVSSLSSDTKNQSKQLLNELIKQVNSIELKPRPQQTQNQPEEKTEPKMLPAEPNKEIQPLKPEEKIIPQAQIHTDDLDPQLIKKLEQIVLQGGSVNQPQLLADMLYKTGRYELAAYFYGLAANDKTQDLSDNDKAWLLLQRAVCLSETDPVQALQIYKSMVSQFPNSPWAELARSNAGTLNWLQTQKPLNLIEQYKKELKTKQ